MNLATGTENGEIRYSAEAIAFAQLTIPTMCELRKDSIVSESS